MDVGRGYGGLGLKDSRRLGLEFLAALKVDEAGRNRWDLIGIILGSII